MLAIIPGYEESSSDEDEKTTASPKEEPFKQQEGHLEVKSSQDKVFQKTLLLDRKDEDNCSTSVEENFILHPDSLKKACGSFSNDGLYNTGTRESSFMTTSLSKSFEKDISNLPECTGAAKCSFKEETGSDGDGKNSHNRLSSEQESVLKYLALKRRRDEEMKQLNMVEDPSESKRTKRNRKKGTVKTSCKPASDSLASGSTSEMQTLTSYIGVNDHLRGSLVDHGDLAPKSGLEKQIDQAISDGDVNKAEELSDYLAKRNFAVRVAEAANARDYHRHKQEEEKKKLAKKNLKKSKLAWGFEVKHRWEMKGNM